MNTDRNKKKKKVAVVTGNSSGIGLETHLLSIKAEHQERIRPNLHPTYNERHQKIIEMID